MPRILALMFPILLTLFCSAKAQDEESSDEWRIIFSEGEADTLVKPDEIVFFLTIEASHLDIDSARNEYDKKIKKLVDVTRKMRIAKDDIRMDLLNIEPDYLMRGAEGTDFNPRAFSSNSDEPELREYHVMRSLTIVLRDDAKYTDFLEEILRLDIELDRLPLYRVSNPDEIQQALTIRAIRDAKARATRLASELGMEVTRPVRVGQADWYDPSEYSYSSYGGGYGGYSGSQGTRSPLYPDMISLSVTVSVTFQMTPDED